MDTPVGKLRDATHLTETDLKFYMQRFAGESQRLVPSGETASLSKRLGAPRNHDRTATVKIIVQQLWRACHDLTVLVLGLSCFGLTVFSAVYVQMRTPPRAAC